MKNHIAEHSAQSCAYITLLTSLSISSPLAILGALTGGMFQFVVKSKYNSSWNKFIQPGPRKKVRLETRKQEEEI